MFRKHKQLRLVCFSFGILEQGGGFENFLITLTSGLASNYDDLDITIVTMSPKIVERLQHALSIYFLKKQGSKSIYRESRRSVLRRLGKVRYMHAKSIEDLREILLEGDIIYTKNELLELTTLRLVGIKHLPPMMTGIHTPLVYPQASSLSAKLHNTLYKSLFYKWLIRPVAAVHVSNHEDCEYVQRVLKPRRLKLLPQPMGFKSAAKSDMRTGKLRLLFVGRLAAIKGMDLLRSIITELDKVYGGRYELKIAGSGEPSVAHSFKKLGKENKSVEYLGHVDNELIHELYEWTDVTVITSVYETLSKVAIETSMSKRIVISTNISGPREVVVDGETGFLLPSDAKAFCRKIMELDELRLSAPKDFAAIGRAAHTYVEKKYSDDAVFASFYKELRGLVAA